MMKKQRLGLKFRLYDLSLRCEFSAGFNLLNNRLSYNRQIPILQGDKDFSCPVANSEKSELKQCTCRHINRLGTMADLAIIVHSIYNSHF